MKRHRLSILIVCVLALGFFARPAAAAAPSLRDALKGEARTAFDEGTRLYKDGKFDDARGHFETAYKASGDKRLLFNVAVCEKSVGHNANAVRALEQSIDDRASVPADYVDKAKQALAALREHTSLLTVETSAPDATIKVDGAAVTAQPYVVDEGPHIVTAEKQGFQQATEKLTVQGGQPSRVALVLVQAVSKLARLRVTSDRTDDTIAIDDKPRAMGPVDVELEPGQHQVVVARPGGASKKVSILVRDGESRDLNLSLPEEKKGGISPWWFVIGGALVAGAATTAIVIATRPTKFEGNGGGSLNPGLVTTGYRGDLR